jgi:hypothetical protein
MTRCRGGILRRSVAGAQPGEILNTFGEDGGELVSVAQIENPMGGKSLVAYMKRPKA